MMQYLIPFKTSDDTPERLINLKQTVKRLNELEEHYSIDYVQESFNRSNSLYRNF